MSRTRVYSGVLPLTRSLDSCNVYVVALPLGVMIWLDRMGALAAVELTSSIVICFSVAGMVTVARNVGRRLAVTLSPTTPVSSTGLSFSVGATVGVTVSIVTDSTLLSETLPAMSTTRACIEWTPLDSGDTGRSGWVASLPKVPVDVPLDET